jgi:hypothetical protein
VAGPGVVELARAAVRRLAEAAPAAGAAREVLHQLERVGAGPPYTVALAGDHAARTALLDHLAGEHLFDPARRDPERVLMTLRRGPMTALRARLRDGSVEDRTLEAPVAGASTDESRTLELPRDRATTAETPTLALPRDRATTAETPTLALPRDRATTAETSTLALPRDRATTAETSTLALPRDRATTAETSTLALPRERATTAETSTLALPRDRATTAEPPTAAGGSARPAPEAPEAPGAPDTPDAPDAIVEPAAVEPTALVRRPPWWAVWRWVLLWLRAWRARRAAQGVAAPVPSDMAPRVVPGASSADALPGAAADARPDARAGHADAAAAVRSAPARVARQAAPPVDPRRRFVDALRACFADDTVERLFVEASRGPLPDTVVVIELPSRASASSLEAVGADACVVACGERGFAMTAQLEAVLAVVPHLFAVGTAAVPPGCDPRVRRLGDVAELGPALVRLATIERSLGAGARAISVLSSGCAAIDDAIAAAEAGFRKRIERLEALRITRPDDHTAAALAGVRQAIVEHAHRAIRRALDDLDAAIAQAGAAWSAQLAAAVSTDALRTIAARLDETSPAALDAAQAAVHRALIDDLTEHARAHHRDLVSALGPPAASPSAAPPWLTVEVAIGELGAGTSLGAVAPRLSSLFRSLDALRSDALALLAQRIATVRQRASASVLDVEPRLEPAVTGTLAIALRAEVEHHARWLEAELTRERVAIDEERAQLAVLAIARDTAGADERALVSALEALAAELPGSSPRSR